MSKHPHMVAKWCKSCKKTSSHYIIWLSGYVPLLDDAIVYDDLESTQAYVCLSCGVMSIDLEEFKEIIGDVDKSVCSTQSYYDYKTNTWATTQVETRHTKSNYYSKSLDIKIVDEEEGATPIIKGA